MPAQSPSSSKVRTYGLPAADGRHLGQKALLDRTVAPEDREIEFEALDCRRRRILDNERQAAFACRVLDRIQLHSERIVGPYLHARKHQHACCKNAPGHVTPLRRKISSFASLADGTLALDFKHSTDRPEADAGYCILQVMLNPVGWQLAYLPASHANQENRWLVVMGRVVTSQESIAGRNPVNELVLEEKIESTINGDWSNAFLVSDKVGKIVSGQRLGAA